MLHTLISNYYYIITQNKKRSYEARATKELKMSLLSTYPKKKKKKSLLSKFNMGLYHLVLKWLIINIFWAKSQTKILIDLKHYVYC